MLQLVIGFIIGAVVATVCFTSGLAQRFYDYASTNGYTTDYSAPTAAPGYNGAPGSGTQGYGAEPPGADGSAGGPYNAQDPASSYQAPYQAPAGGYPGATGGYVNSAALTVSVVPATASPGGDTSCSAYALANRTNQAVVISFADAQAGYAAARDRGLLVRPGETKVHTIPAFEDRNRSPRDERSDREDGFSYGDPLYREGSRYESSRDDPGEKDAEAATCATIEVKNSD